MCKGGHAASHADDYLFFQGKGLWLKAQKINNSNTHGTGCTLSSALAAALAKDGNLTKAAVSAKKYIEQAIIAGANYEIGNGHGPVNHFFGLF